MTDFNEVKTNLLNGKPILIYHDEEDESALVIAGEFLNETTYKTLRHYATGDVAVMMGKEIAEKFGMPLLSDALELASQNDSLAEDAIVQSHAGPTFDLKSAQTGSADMDKVKAINRLADICKTKEYSKFFEEFIMPGHIRTYLAKEGLLDERHGHTELGVFLSKYFNLSGIVCMITLKNLDDGHPLNKQESVHFAKSNKYPIAYQSDILDKFRDYRADKTENKNDDSVKTITERFKKLLYIRQFEQKIEELFRDKRIRGSFHLAIGQEATGVALGVVLKKTDAVFATHRGHHIALGMDVDPKLLFMEFIGREGGLNDGRAGPMHFSSPDDGFWLANGIVAANAAISTGVALAKKVDNSNSVVVNVIGEGSTDEGIFYESLNIASLWKLPLITICENNQYSQSTKFENHIPVSNLSERVAKTFGISSEKILLGTDLNHLILRLNEIVKSVRESRKPMFVEIMTYRFCGHSMSDINQEYKDSSLNNEWQLKDPILLYEKYLKENNKITTEKIANIYKEIKDNINNIVNEVL